MLVTATPVHALEKRVCAENLALHYEQAAPWSKRDAPGKNRILTQNGYPFTFWPFLHTEGSFKVETLEELKRDLPGCGLKRKDACVDLLAFLFELDGVIAGLGEERAVVHADCAQGIDQNPWR